ncbi:hypothetical protein SNE40_008404 [Patella caerulea]|uniref:CARD domain-containing protein n=1 Tax=Patella caerulea TaxID=87958 RepID=A0AAN8K6L3_PATCE
MNETKDTIDNISQHTLKVMMSLDSPVIYSQSEDREHPQGVIDKTKHLSVEPKPDAPIEGHQSEPSPSDVEPGNAVEDNSKKDDELNGTHKGALGFDSGVNRTQEIGTWDSPELSQMMSNMANEQQTGGLVSTEEHAAALERIKHLEEVTEKLSKKIQESHVNNQQSVKADAESGQTSLKEVVDDDVDDDADGSKEEWIENIIPAIYSNERMNKNDQLKIQRNMRSLWLNIEPKELIIELHSLLVFDIDEFDYLLDYVEEKGRDNGALKMLRKLYRKGPNSYILFLVALERCNHTCVIKIVEPDCKICEGRIKYSGQKYYELIDNTSPKYKEFVRRCEKNIEDVYDDHPGQQFVVVKKLAEGCVEVTFHLISLGYNNEEDLRRPLEDLVKSGFIDTDPVKPDEFYFRKITDEELASERESMTQRRNIVLEKEIETLKLQINELQLENAALRATSANSQEVGTYKEHLAKKYTDTLQDKELIISSLQDQLNQQATDINVDTDQQDDERSEQDKESDLTVLPIADNQDKDKMEKREVVDDDVNDNANDSKEEWIENSIPTIYSNERMNINDRLKIQRHMKFLWLNIEPKELIIELHSLLVFDKDEFDYLLDYVEEKGRNNGVLKMLSKLYRKGSNSYILFLVALERCNHTWVIKTLEPDCVIYEGRIKYSGQKYYELIDNTSPKYKEFVRRCEKNIEDVYDDHPGQQFVVVKKLE